MTLASPVIPLVRRAPFGYPPRARIPIGQARTTMAHSKDKPPRPPGRPRDEALAQRRREEMVHHAIEEFARQGYNGADLDLIAANAGCSKGTLYNYFPSKGELFSASVDHVMFSMVAAIGEEDSDEA